MILALLAVVVAGTLAFSRVERLMWGSARTPFAFIAYPFLLAVFLATFVGPRLGFFPLHSATMVFTGAFFALVALSSLAIRIASGDDPDEGGDAIEAAGTPPTSPPSIGALEYGIVGALLMAAFFGALAGGVGEIDLEKGDLAVGGFRGHLMDFGVAYLVVALSQRKGFVWARLPFAALMLWILLVNQVKYLILIPLAGAVLYRWVTGSLRTWMVAVIGATVPLAIVVVVYAVVGTAAVPLVEGSPWALLDVFGQHMLSYVVAGVVGLDQFIVRGHVAWLDLDGLAYVFSPFVNVVRLLTSRLSYFNVVNPDYLVIHSDGFLDSNVFTLPGSVAYRGGWILAALVSMAFGLASYAVWRRWRHGSGALACAAGTYWLATGLFSWHDPFFIHLSTVEIVGFLWLRAFVAERYAAGKSLATDP